MPNGMCQTCGTVAPIEWFLTEPLRRQFEAVLVKLPKPVEEQVFFYLSLFRPATGKSLTPKKALRLLTELRDLVATGYVSKHGLVDRPCQAHIWGQAIETMANQRHSLTLPMQGHKYLCKVAYDLADAADKKQEAGKDAAHHKYSRESSGSTPVASINPLAHLMEE